MCSTPPTTPAGNLATVRTQRDGATRTVTFGYDLFGLVPTHTKLDATGVPSTRVFVRLRPGQPRAAQLDRRQPDTARRRLRRLRPPAPLDGDATRRPTRRGVDDELSRLLRRRPGWAPHRRHSSSAIQWRQQNVATAAGRTGTVFLDELGRERRTELALGSDYANEVLVVGSRTYDGFGRVVFEADPYPKSQDPATAYGTSYHFKNTGDLDCIIRGRGQQPLNMVTDVATERFPTCFERSFIDHVETLDVRDAASLQAGSPQAGVVKRVVSSAIGRVIERSTVKAGARLDYATFSHDRLGQQTSMTRFLDPAGGTTPCSGRGGSIPSGRRCSWRSRRPRPAFTPTATGANRSRRSGPTAPSTGDWCSRYDALGRLTATEERNNGVADPETVNKYAL